MTTAEVQELVIANYSLGDLQRCTLIRRGFNDHYLIESAGEQCVFRAYSDKYFIDSPRAFLAELQLLEHLHHEGIPVADALRRNDGDLLGWTATSDGERAYALFPFADGVELDEETVTDEQAFHLGKVMADLHLAADRFDGELERYHLDLTYLVDEPLRLIGEQQTKLGADADFDKVLGQVNEFVSSLQPLDRLTDAVRALGTDPDEYGIIHADLHVGNVHFRGNDPTVFDFDHCAYGWRAYDLAIALMYSSTIGEAMVKGYESVRPLSDAERTCLPVFAQLRNLWEVGDTLGTIFGEPYIDPFWLTSD